MRKILLITFVLFAVILAVSIRGIAGNPTASDLNTPKWKEFGPFELSPERGRFALLYSFIEDHSLIFQLPVARFAAPDLGYTNGNYVSLFAPGVSFAAMPGYFLGKMFGLAQIGTVAVIAIFALINAFLVYKISKVLGANDYAALTASTIFLFATPAFAYAVTLYQHHISLFLILSSIYALLRWKNFLGLCAVWFLVAVSIPVDYPNLILMAPIALWATGRIIWGNMEKKGFTISINFWSIFTPLVALLPLAFYVWFSLGSYNKPLQLSGTIDSVQAINAKGKPTTSALVIDQPVKEIVAGDNNQNKSATGFFRTRNLLNGFYIHFLSPDRGVIYYAPIVLLGILGIFTLWSKKQKEVNLLVSVAVMNIVLYSLWGDPWGGWAFGSRYLIPTYSILSILLAQAISAFIKKKSFLILFLILSIYSIAVNTLGAISSSANPPKVQVLALEKQTGKIQKYSVDRNLNYVLSGYSKSFVYNSYLSKTITPITFYSILTVILSAGMLFLAFKSRRDHA